MNSEKSATLIGACRAISENDRFENVLSGWIVCGMYVCMYVLKCNELQPLYFRPVQHQRLGPFLFIQPV